MNYDRVIIGAGFYGLYSALYCAKKGESVLVVEIDDDAFKRATYINQARVHMGYHYPRSLSTASKSCSYFDRFVEDFGDSIKHDFDKVYATASRLSWTDGSQFKKFCDAANIYCEEINNNKYFKTGQTSGSFLTKEYTYDAAILKHQMLTEIKRYPNVTISFSTFIKRAEKHENKFKLFLSNGQTVQTGFVLNATYASINQVHEIFGVEPFKIKYELCEIILCKVNDKLKNVGITVMDGPFFSLMPFGKTEYHSLTSVTFTPHITSFEPTPHFVCQSNTEGCKPLQTANCNYCEARPVSAWEYMSTLARKFLKDEYKFEYAQSLYSVKPILKTSEIDDSRPTVIRKFSSAPTLVSVLSGKINTVYDLEEILNESC